VVLAGSIGAFLLPVALQALGWMHQVWHVEDGRIVLEPSVLHIGGPATLVLLIAGNIGAIVVASMFARTMAESRDSAQRRVEIQAWHLRKLLPVETPRPAAPDVSCH
jgi:serine/threonine-protein kinase